LTPREREVAALVAEGLSNAEIAERLTVSAGTVGNHVGHILRALGARNRAHIAAWAVRQGLDGPER
jgi:DNA-binding CsgD family transcriptional regulator